MGGKRPYCKPRPAAPGSAKALMQQWAAEDAATQADAIARGLYRGEPDCTDCQCQSHCETHHKAEGTYP